VRTVTQDTADTGSKHLYAMRLATVDRMVSPFFSMPRAIAAAVCLSAVLVLPGCGLLAPAPEPAAPPAAPEPAPVPPKPVAPPVAADARPRVERLNSGPPNHPYEIKGERYAPENSDVPMVESGLASWYGKPFHGKRTASGEVYDMNAMTAAHKTMPLPSYALVRNPANGREVVVKVNDRGPFIKGRVIDLSRAAARQLRIGGVANVEVRRLTHAEIRTGSWKLPVQRVAGAP
jgi:rare lipoprotein A